MKKDANKSFFPSCIEHHYPQFGYTIVDNSDPFAFTFFFLSCSSLQVSCIKQQDIVETLSGLGLIKYWKGQHIISATPKVRPPVFLFRAKTLLSPFDETACAPPPPFPYPFYFAHFASRPLVSCSVCILCASSSYQHVID
jgi:hypothetical protein